MEELIGRIRKRIGEGAYGNEAAVSVGILMPILRELGWDSSDPDQVLPEFSSGRGRVDFALCSPPRRPAIFVEVKGVGRSLDGDRQLFEYAFHEGVPLCLLTDGREWSFYLPGGQGNYDDRRVYRLQLDERSPSECARAFHRYLQFNRVKSGEALADASQDYRDAAARREASRSMPQAWDELISEPEELLIDLLADRAEALCGYRPSRIEAVTFLQNLSVASLPLQRSTPDGLRPARNVPPSFPTSIKQVPAKSNSGQIAYSILGLTRSAPTGNAVLVDILSTLASRQPDKVPELAAAVKGRSRNHVARTAAEIYPARPDLARAAEFAPGWLVGLNISNREKIGIIREACRIFEIKFGEDVVIDLPHA